ncbi:MAG TPA: hypothetical protein VJ044_14955 [Candidatus Hodarchaeales archaeon]|nr:hypothetical protein [Candidatus Hodarchaeales archaeon]
MDENRLAEIHLRHVIDDLRQQLQDAEQRATEWQTEYTQVKEYEAQREEMFLAQIAKSNERAPSLPPHLRALLKYYDEGIGWMYNEGALEDNEYREAKELGQATVAWLESQE